ncbi:LysR substrate-binding domain-containing protein [Maliponia aquimaris]|uniref:Glycine cleavage system transcriptional activator n=1 Tax=Maliponia aquimaris TaxID=1673631 RepID=A0A238L106_9RHOB|nr:LysR substrate-binding domain-containing protein [Maliponia aquimaris]SMX48677.1 Glycine cleavage system transcriptional activator [Maliponia aquimaris]
MTEVDWHRLPPLTTLRAFEATARLGGYSAAARSLNVTTAAIAQQVRKLEAELGLALVRREGRGLAMTRAGQGLGAALGTAFAQIVKGIDDVTAQEAARGVRVSTTVRFVDAVIMPDLGDFWARHPGVQVSFSPDGNDAAIDLDAYDIVVRGGAPGQRWEGAEATPLLRTPFILCAAPGLLGDGPPDLSDLPWIRDVSIGGGVWEAVVRRAGCDPARLRVVDPGGAKFELEAALLGYGLHLSPEITVRRPLQDGRLVRVDLPFDWLAVYYALSRKGPLSDPVRLFRDWLVTLCAPLSSGPPDAI